MRNQSGHYCDVIMSPTTSQITSLTIVYSIVYSGTDQRIHQNSASLAFVRGIHRRPVNSPHKWPVTRKMFPFDDVIMVHECIDHNGPPAFTETREMSVTMLTLSWNRKLSLWQMHININIYMCIHNISWQPPSESDSDDNSRVSLWMTGNFQWPSRPKQNAWYDAHDRLGLALLTLP